MNYLQRSQITSPANSYNLTVPHPICYTCIYIKYYIKRPSGKNNFHLNTNFPTKSKTPFYNRNLPFQNKYKIIVRTNLYKYSMLKQALKYKVNLKTEETTVTFTH